MHPMFFEGMKSFMANKCIYVVRNPLDVFPSYAARGLTLTHSHKTDYSIHEEDPEYWDWFVRKQAKMMQKYHEIVVRH